MDRVWLKGVECRVRLGVPKRERSRVQRVIVDVGMEFDSVLAAATDDVDDTVDYFLIEKSIRRTAESGERKLTERLAADIVKTVLSADRRIRSVAVAVHKRPAAMPKTHEVVVELIRRR